MLGNVRLFQSTRRVVSTEGIVRDVLGMAFDDGGGAYDALRQSGYRVSVVQRPEYCHAYMFGSVGELFRTSEGLAALASYAASTRLGVELGVLDDIERSPDGRGVLRNIGKVVGSLCGLGMGLGSGGVRFYDYMLVRGDVRVVDEFLVAYLCVLGSVLSVPEEVVMRETERVCGRRVERLSDGVLVEWGRGVCGACGVSVSWRDFETHWAYAYIVSYYAGVRIEGRDGGGSVESERAAAHGACKCCLDALGIPRELFVRSGVSRMEVDHVLSFLFYFTQRRWSSDGAARAIAGAMRGYVERKRMKLRAGVVSSVFGTTTVWRGVLDNWMYRETVACTREVQGACVGIVYEGWVEGVGGMQSVCRCAVEATGAIIVEEAVKDVQSVCRRGSVCGDISGVAWSASVVQGAVRGLVQASEYCGVKSVTSGVQGVCRSGIVGEYARHTAECAVSVQTVVREMEERVEYGIVEAASLWAVSVIQSALEGRAYCLCVRGSESVQSVWRGCVVKGEYMEKEQACCEAAWVLRGSIAAAEYGTMVSSCAGACEVMRGKLCKALYNEECAAASSVWSVLVGSTSRELYESVESGTADVQSVVRGIEGVSGYGASALSVDGVVSVVRSKLCVSKYEGVVGSQKALASVMRACLVMREREVADESARSVQGVSRSVVLSEGLREVSESIARVRTAMAQVIAVSEYNAAAFSSSLVHWAVVGAAEAREYKCIESVSKSVEAECRQRLLRDGLNEAVMSSKAVQSVVGGCVQGGEYNTCVGVMRYVQCRSVYEWMVNGAVEAQSVARRVCTLGIGVRVAATRDVGGCGRGSIVRRRYVAGLESSVGVQSVARSCLAQREYNCAWKSSVSVQGIVRCVVLCHLMSARVWGAVCGQSVCRWSVVKTGDGARANEHIVECERKRALRAECVCVEAIMREKIVRYGLHLDDEVLGSLSYSTELYNLVHRRVEERKARRIWTSPSKGLESPSGRLLPQDVVMNTVYRGRTTRMSFGRVESSRDILYEYLRKTKRSVIDIAFSNIRMMERESVEEVQIGVKQLYEQVRQSEWFRVMFTKYNCVRHLLMLLERSNRSQPYLEMVQLSLGMLQMLVNDKASLCEFVKLGLGEATAARVGEVMRNNTDIGVVSGAARLLLCVCRAIPETRSVLVDVCRRMESKLGEMEGKERAEERRAESLRQRTGRDVIFERATPHVRSLIGLVLKEQGKDKDNK